MINHESPECVKQHIFESIPGLSRNAVSWLIKSHTKYLFANDMPVQFVGTKTNARRGGAAGLLAQGRMSRGVCDIVIHGYLIPGILLQIFDQKYAFPN